MKKREVYTDLDKLPPALPGTSVSPEDRESTLSIYADSADPAHPHPRRQRLPGVSAGPPGLL